jgi:hypothetical protein
MAILAESLVEEWLNREGFFTVRGVKSGVEEIDLLAIRHGPGALVIGWHVEVQVSFRPVRYVAQLTPDIAKALNKSPSSAVARTPEQVDTCARYWVQSKFKAPNKAKVREGLWPNVTWSYHLVHAKVKHPRELDVFQQEGVECRCFRNLLKELSSRTDHHFSGSAGGDLAEIIAYYSKAPNT